METLDSFLPGFGRWGNSDWFALRKRAGLARDNGHHFLCTRAGDYLLWQIHRDAICDTSVKDARALSSIKKILINPILYINIYIYLYIAFLCVCVCSLSLPFLLLSASFFLLLFDFRFGIDRNETEMRMKWKWDRGRIRSSSSSSTALIRVSVALYQIPAPIRVNQVFIHVHVYVYQRILLSWKPLALCSSPSIQSASIRAGEFPLNVYPTPALLSLEPISVERTLKSRLIAIHFEASTKRKKKNSFLSFFLLFLFIYFFNHDNDYKEERKKRRKIGTRTAACYLFTTW